MTQFNEGSNGAALERPKVSVVMPTYNRAKELPRSIRSVLSQSFSNFELIIVDDASTDNTEDVIKLFQDSRIIYEKLVKNVGGAEARNVGIRLAKADIVAFQDSDDEWTCSKLETSLRELGAEGDVGAVFSSFIQIWDKGCRLMPVGKHQFQQDNVYDSLLWQNHVDTPTLVVKKKYLDEVGGFDSSMPRYQDWDLALRLANVTSLKLIRLPLILSYVTTGSITHNQDAHRIALEKIHKKHMNYIVSKRKLKAAWLHRVGDAQISTGVKAGRWLLVEALKCDPLNMRYFVKFLFSLLGNSILYKKLNKPFKS